MRVSVPPQVYWCSYMVILNIKSRPQLQAVIAKMERVAEEEFGRTIPSTAENSRHALQCHYVTGKFLEQVNLLLCAVQNAYATSMRRSCMMVIGGGGGAEMTPPSVQGEQLGGRGRGAKTTPN